jgi:hypothetical protein
MKRLLSLILVILSSWPFLLHAQKSTILVSKVVSATVFVNRATVTREAELDLTPGQHQLLFSGLTPTLADETVRVSGEGSAAVKILDVKVETEFTGDIQNREIRELQKKLEAIKLDDQKASDRKSVLESQKSFIESIRVESTPLTTSISRFVTGCL